MTESFELDDFEKEEWLNRPEYNQYQGVGFDHVTALHSELPGMVAHYKVLDDFYVFEYLRGHRWTLWVYSIVGYGHDKTDPPYTIAPAFWIYGTTFDGWRETHGTPDSPAPWLTRDLMNWICEWMAEKGLEAV